MKQSTPRTFTAPARKSPNQKAVNSGIFSNSGKGQKMDGLPRPSPSSGPVEGRKKADVMSLRKACKVPQKKSLPKSGAKDASSVQKYALKHGEK